MKGPLVSVVMPTYNCQKYIRESIDSILNQTYKNLEFIIVDGHSNDETKNILEKYVCFDKRIKVIYDEQKGIGAALKLGCSKAQGEYIARMDSDDISLPFRIEEEVKILESHKDVILVSCSALYINDKSEFLGYSFPYTAQTLLKRNVTSILHPGVLMRKKTYEQVGGYAGIIRAEDYFLWNRLIKKGKFKIVKYPLMKYRIIPEALSNTMSSYFNLNFSSFYKPFIEKSIVTFEDEKVINDFIRNEILSDVLKRKNPVRRIENVLLKLFMLIFSYKVSFKIVLFVKNIYGFVLILKKNNL